MGLHTGEAERVGDDYRGRPVNRAARIMSLAHGGQILVSDVAAALLRTGPHPVDVVDLGPQRLRDLADPERVWQVLHPDLDGPFPPVGGLARTSNNLPVPRSSLVGRAHEVARVTALLQQHRIVTLTGVGGVGKTRLAVQAATDLLGEYRHVWFVELAGIADPDDVADAVARTVGAPAVADPVAAATALLAADRTLLVLDNCEHVVDSAAAVIDELTMACPRLSVVATSREPLDIEGEHVVGVRPLDPATGAATLFRMRAAAAGTDVDGVARSTIEHLCRRLDGIPLAIELAAARTASLGVAAIVDALDDRFSLLRGGPGRRRAIDRHGTMRATIEWSYRLLEPAEQRLLQWLAVFPSGFELDAAEHVAGCLGLATGGQGAAVDHLASLVHKSMVAAEPHAAGLRYRMLETVRAFALEQLDAGDSAGPVARPEPGDFGHPGAPPATTSPSPASEGPVDPGRSGEQPVHQRHLALGALAGWVATITDLPFTQPCNAAVERHAIRLEREADTWREAVVFAARIGSGALAARLCGPPVAFFLLGRHDLAHFVRPLLDLCGADPHQRRAVLCALMVSAAGATAPDQLQAWADEMQAADDADPTGLGTLMRWLALAWRGDFATSVQVCVEASLDPRLHRSTRDMMVGIATLDRFSLTDARDDPHGLVDRALEVAGRSDVAMHRVTCLLGAAWGVADTQPDRSLDLVRRALDDIANVPALTRHTLPGGASRLLTRLDPQVAAQGLLEQLDATPSYRTFVDLIPVFYATALLHRVGHPSARSELAPFTGSATAPYLSMMDSVDLARRAASSHLVSLGDLAATVRSALVDIAGGDLAAGRVGAAGRG
jgi:predicted ATPase